MEVVEDDQRKEIFIAWNFMWLGDLILDREETKKEAMNPNKYGKE